VDQGTSRTRDDLTPKTKAELDPVDPVVKTAVGAETPERPYLLVCCPIRAEFSFVSCELAKLHPRRACGLSARYHSVFSIGSHLVLVVQSGFGKQTSVTIEQLLKVIDPQAVCLIGFAGSLVNWLKVGDTIEPSAVFSSNESELSNVIPDSLGLSTIGEPLVTVSAVVSTPKEKAAIQKRFKAAAVDMEAYELGRLCNSIGKPFHLARAVSDGPNDCIPEAFDGVILSSGDLSFGRLFAAVAKKPSLVASIPGLWEKSRRAKDGLRDIVLRLLIAILGQDQSS
jgi:nucleoside phosphorylase